MGDNPSIVVRGFQRHKLALVELKPNKQIDATLRKTKTIASNTIAVISLLLF